MAERVGEEPGRGRASGARAVRYMCVWARVKGKGKRKGGAGGRRGGGCDDRQGARALQMAEVHHRPHGLLCPRRDRLYVFP